MFGQLNTTFSHFSLPTAREGNVFIGVCHSVHNQSHAYSVTAHPCWLLGHLLWRGWYASYWNAFFFFKSYLSVLGQLKSSNKHANLRIKGFKNQVPGYFMNQFLGKYVFPQRVTYTKLNKLTLNEPAIKLNFLSYLVQYKLKLSLSIPL